MGRNYKFIRQYPAQSQRLLHDGSVYPTMDMNPSVAMNPLVNVRLSVAMNWYGAAVN